MHELGQSPTYTFLLPGILGETAPARVAALAHIIANRALLCACETHLQGFWQLHTSSERVNTITSNTSAFAFSSKHGARRPANLTRPSEWRVRVASLAINNEMARSFYGNLPIKTSS